ncbi:MAG: RsmB/NOP family class I SAM-dependent RNA methyltransferase [Maricaulaceae bacterium]
MKTGGRIAAAIEILEAWSSGRRPIKDEITDWGKRSRFAGSKDRAFISGLVLDALRRKASLGALMGADTARALAVGAHAHVWGWSVEAIEAAFAQDDHAPEPLTPAERAGLTATLREDATHPVRGDYPAWLDPMMRRAFGDRAVAEGQALAARAPVDLRLNTLKAEPEKALKAVAAIGAQPSAWLVTGARVPPAPSPARGGGVETIRAFAMGWVEVQDQGSQIAALAAGSIQGAQVLDYCAGGGGKTLALAAMSGNTGQIYAYDADARRLMPAIHRAKRAGARAVQFRSPKDPEPLADLVGKMDVVFVDAPCSGSGTWRRKPDAKWRLKPAALAKRQAEQDTVLAEAWAYVKPGGRLVYAVCSVFLEEAEDRVDAFLRDRGNARRRAALEAMAETALLTAPGREAIAACVTPLGDIRLTPAAPGVDGFFVSVIERLGSVSRAPA